MSKTLQGITTDDKAIMNSITISGNIPWLDMTKIMFPINLQLCRTVIVITVSLGQKTVQ